MLVLGARSGARIQELTLDGAGAFVDFAVTDAAVYAVFADTNVSVASMQLDDYCRPDGVVPSQHATPSLRTCNGSSIAFAGATDAYVLLCGAENTSTVAGALALHTGRVESWPSAGAGVPRLVQFLPHDGVNASFAVHYTEPGAARLLTQNGSGAFAELRAVHAGDDRDWAYAADAVRATTGGGGAELLFLPGEHPRVAELFANGSARAWQLRGCFEYEMSDHGAFAHAALFARADCRKEHELVDIENNCSGAFGATASALELYLDGDLGYVLVPQCRTQQQIFAEAAQRLIFGNTSPQRKVCAQNLACEYGSQAVAAGATECVCRTGFFRNQSTGRCGACDAGTFSNTTEAEDCTACPSGTPFSHRASTGARSCFAAYGIRAADADVLNELRALAAAVQPVGDTVSVHAEPEPLPAQNASLAELRARLNA